MAKKKKQEIKDNSRYDGAYNLKTDAVKRLTEANESNSPTVSQSDIEKYKSGFLYRIPMWLKALFIKFWFNGAVCYFFLWGLSLYIPNIWDQILVIMLALGVVTDLLVNNLFRFISDDLHDYSKWMMFPQKRLWTLFANILYAAVIVLCVVQTYGGVNNLAVMLGSAPDMVFLGVEPIMFGVFCLVFDMLFITIKNTLKKIIKDAREKAEK